MTVTKALPVYEGFFQEPISQKVLRNYGIYLIVYDLEEKRIAIWKK